MKEKVWMMMMDVKKPSIGNCLQPQPWFQGGGLDDVSKGGHLMSSGAVYIGLAKLSFTNAALEKANILKYGDLIE